ncbi:hypothetical protein PVAP13_3KG174727 [Panicum virgatum]|uniref:Uncharacterized protein n=1 Tax=Panicum virgatum TaxID=38727 RepID=A0A8T0UUE1_PANVG|nr:hypothetical protein PVAP13_3KG174727 [Panicum virgatum]
MAAILRIFANSPHQKNYPLKGDIWAIWVGPLEKLILSLPHPRRHLAHPPAPLPAPTYAAASLPQIRLPSALLPAGGLDRTSISCPWMVAATISSPRSPCHPPAWSPWTSTHRRRRPGSSLICKTTTPTSRATARKALATAGALVSVSLAHSALWECRTNVPEEGGLAGSRCTTRPPTELRAGFVGLMEGGGAV